MRWYVFDGEIKKGPYGAADVREMLRQGALSLDTFVMREGSPLKRKLLDVVEGLAQDLVSETSQKVVGGAAGTGGGEFGGRHGNTAIAASLPMEAKHPVRVQPTPSAPPPASPRAAPVRSSFSSGPLSHARPSEPEKMTAFAPAAAPQDLPHDIRALPLNAELERLRAENERLLKEQQKSSDSPLRAAAGREAPEHQRARTESESRLKASGEKIRWQKNRVNMSSDLAADGTSGRNESSLDDPDVLAGKAAPPLGRSALGAAPQAPRPRGRTPRVRERKGRTNAEAPFPLLPVVLVGLFLLLIVVIGIAKERMSNMKESIAASRVAREDAEWLATQALMKAEQTRVQKEKELRELERQQKSDLREATAEARKDARRALIASRKKAEATRKSGEASAASGKSRLRPEARILPSAQKPKKQKASKKQVSRQVSHATLAPPAPGWPSTVVSKGPQLRANAFKVVSVVGIRVQGLPAAGCSPCQTRGTMADGTQVTLVAPTFTPFVPAKMAGATRVAVKALVQASGEFRLLVQSAVKN
ncbi:MAG: DUF4339 domain-containing protein [Silvanigrellales bacterium]|nr:DUF4339 domain-containing protein [Silvanigrellales bacterium]